MTSRDLTAARLRELVDYDPLTGIFTRKVRTAQRHQVGDRADYRVNTGSGEGYWDMMVDSQKRRAHVWAWLYMTGEWPKALIDHYDTDRGNNRFSNLREGTKTTNAENMRRARTDNRSGFLGVTSHKPGRFVAKIQAKGKVHYLGIFDTPELAHACYLKAKRLMHEGCTL